MSQKKKLSKRLLALVITLSVIAVFLSAILITNIFIPLKYLSAYINVKADKLQNGEMRISFVDVGDGDCTVVEFPDGKVALIDGANGSYNNELKIFKKLNAFGIDKIDYLFCTSSASKRCGGLAEIVKYKSIGKVYAPIYKNGGVTEAYRNFRKEVKKKDKNIIECTYGAGEYNEEYGYCLFVLYPENNSQDNGSESVTSSSIWISYGGVNILLLGDLTASQLNDLYETYTVTGFEINGHSIILEDCNVVKVPNGGNKSGTFTQLYDLIQAETAIISTDKEPALRPVADVDNFSNGIYRTNINGTVTLSINDGNYRIKKERQ